MDSLYGVWQSYTVFGNPLPHELAFGIELGPRSISLQNIKVRPILIHYLVLGSPSNTVDAPDVQSWACRGCWCSTSAKGWEHKLLIWSWTILF